MAKLFTSGANYRQKTNASLALDVCNLSGYGCRAMKSHRDRPTRPYEVELAPDVEKILRNKFPGRLTDEVVSFLQKDLRFNPDEFGPYGRKLSGPIKNKYSAKRRRFRIIYILDESTYKIKVIGIDPL